MSEQTLHSDFHRKNVERKQADPRSNEELIQAALNAEDDEAYWAATAVLWYRPQDQVIAISRHLLASDDAEERTLGAHILGQGGAPESMPPDDSLPILLPLSETEQDAGVLGAIALALGYIGDARTIEPLMRLKDHPASAVRYGVVHGLLHQCHEYAVTILTRLSADPDVDVRNWATFGLGSLEEVDTPAIRAALWARVADENDEVRAEALEGLALRGDRGIVELLIQEVTAVEDEMWPPLYRAAVEAGTRLGDPHLYETLIKLRAFTTAGKIDEELEEAITNCEPTPTAP